MANTPGVDGAWSQLAADLGPEVIPIAATIEGLLTVIGMPELFDYIPTVYYMLQGKGVGNPFGVIQNVISQLMSFDPRKILTDQLNNIMKPMTEPIHAWLPYKHNLVNALQTYPEDANQTVLTLVSSGGFKGDAAKTLVQTNAGLTRYANDLHDRMVNSINADNQLLTKLSDIVNQTVSAFLGGGTGVMFAAVAVIDGTTAAQLGIDVPEDILAAIATGLFIAAVSAPLFTASVNTGIAISVWNGVHQQLRDAVSITLAPMSKPNVPTPSQLPERPDWGPGQESLADDLVKEFGGAVDKNWIKYILGLLGTGVSLQDAAAIIRCLYKNGYFDPQSKLPRTDQKFTTLFKKVWNSVYNHLKPHDIEGAWKDMHNIPSGPKGDESHIVEVLDAQRSLYNLRDALDAKIANPATPPDLRAMYETLRAACQATIDYIDKRIYPNDIPTSWNDQGNVPFGKDILTNSTCATATPAQYPPE